MRTLWTLLPLLLALALVSPPPVHGGDEEEPPENMDELSWKTIATFRKKLYIPAEAGLKKASCRVDGVIEYLGLGSKGKMEGAFRWFEGKGELTEDPQGHLRASGVGGELSDFLGGPYRKTYFAGKKVTAEKLDGGVVLVTVVGKRVETLRFLRDGLLEKRTLDNSTETEFTFTKLKGKLVRTWMSHRTKSGSDTSLLEYRTSWRKIGKYVMPVETVNTFKAKLDSRTGTRTTWTYSGWKVGKKVR